MDEDAEEEVLHKLKWENRMLQQRVFELEEKLQKSGAPPAKRENDSSVTKLLRSKDERLEKLSSQLEQKRSELETQIQDLDKRNALLSLEIASFRLYREVFDAEPVAMIGVNRDGRVVLFNRAAPPLLGEKLRSSLQQPIESLDFAALDASIPALVRTTLVSRQPASRSWRARDRQILTSVIPLGSEKDPAGALLRIAVAPV